MFSDIDYEQKSAEFIIINTLERFYNIHFRLCEDRDCTNPKILFEPSKAYVKAYDTEDAFLVGFLNLPDGSVEEFIFLEDLAELSLTQVGIHNANIHAMKEGYQNHMSTIEFEVVEEITEATEPVTEEDVLKNINEWINNNIIFQELWKIIAEWFEL
ncbi:MAG: hypothetical protein ISS36_02910 [Candidatus Aenigmarchaeota archaeon]|nr:hypothetical protein [Candidatus Aenigmarchaeota archaeon]